MENGLPRRLFHLCSCLILSITALLLPQNIFFPILVLIAVLFLVFEIIRLRSPRVNLWFLNTFRILTRTEKEERGLTGSSYLLMAAVISFWLFPTSIAGLCFAFLAVGDPIGGAVGERWGRKKIRGKSLQGSLAFCLAAFAFGIILNIAVQIPLPILVVGVISATLVEFLSLPPNDNFTIPLFSGGMMILVKFMIFPG